MEFYVFGSRMTAAADVRCDTSMMQMLWKQFCFGCGSLEVTDGSPLTIVIGEEAVPVLPDGKEFAVSVGENGAAVIGADAGGLLRGYFSLLMRISYTSLTEGEERFTLPQGTWTSEYTIGRRMIHFCIFPENDLYFVKKCIRLAGLCQFTHVALEFWGTLQFDCMKELAWENAFTQDEARELVAEIRALGMEPIPMFNQLGHASGARECYGKHVVLDQNPRLQEYFTPDGWAWDIRQEKVRTLLREVRAELYAIFGACEYMLIGCDEAYYIFKSPELRALMPAFLHDLTYEVAAEGRRPMIWRDVFVERGKYTDCYGSGRPEEMEQIFRTIHPSSVIIDWQYHVKEGQVASSLDLNKTGFDIIGAPWLTPANIAAHIETVREGNLFGLMLTTWHTLQSQMSGILFCAHKYGASTFPWTANSSERMETAALMRRVSFEGNSYADSGWSKEQIEY